MEPEIVEKPALRIAGLGTDFLSILSPNANNFEVIPALWGRYLARAGEIQRHGRDDYGIVTCEEGSDGKCHYVAGAELTAGASAPVGMVTVDIPAGRYAVFTHRGPLDRLEHTMRYIHGSWLPRSGFRYREAPEVERYGAKFNPSSPDSELEIWIPLES